MQRNHFDLVIPVGYAMTSAMARHKVEIQTLTHLEVADFEHVQAAADKNATHELAESLSVPVPLTCAPDSSDGAINSAADLELPIVIKFPRETPGSPVWYARTRVEFASLYRAACATRRHDSPLPLIQEYIPGFGVGFFALYQHGECKRIFMHKRIREVPPSGGMSCCAESFFDSRLEDYGRRLLDQLHWHGVAMVEFRYDLRDDDYKLIEINPKFWGSLDLALAAGVDFPWFLCQIAQGKILSFCQDYNRNLRYHWPLLEMRHTLTKPSSCLSVIGDLLRPDVRSNLWWSDPLPNLLEPFERAHSKLKRRFSSPYQRE
jgi:predicted ATP-grasp superfamily ATP-dependent carboligase